MKFTKKFSVTLFASFIAVFIPACDSGELELISSTSTAESLLIPGTQDEIYYTHISSSATPAPFIPSLVLKNHVASADGIGSSLFTYAKSGTHEFSLTGNFNAETALRGALDLILGPTTPEGNRFREIVYKPGVSEPIFTAAEISEIAEILNPSGAEIFIDSEDPTKINSIGKIEISHLVTSTYADFLLGIMAGNYIVTNNGFEMFFRRPSATEIAQYSPTLTNDHWLPAVSSTPVEHTNAETGRWIYYIVN